MLSHLQHRKKRELKDQMEIIRTAMHADKDGIKAVRQDLTEDA